MARRFVIVFLLLFSSLVIIFGGYNCSQQIPLQHPPGGGNPFLGGGNTNGTGGSYYPGSSPGSSGSLPQEPDGDCDRPLHRDYKEKYGAPALLKFNQNNIVDYREGHDLNYAPGCPRLFLKMDKVEGTSVYRGSLAIAYEGEAYTGEHAGKLANLLDIYQSGSSAKDNQFNTWQGSWGSAPSADFAAIFETFKTHKGAMILRITDVKKLEVRDGVQVYKGYGSLWFKMFRAYLKGNDPCYNSGGYLTQVHTTPTERYDRCWLTTRKNPFTCRPRGIGTAVNLRESLNCYKKLADFGYLDIHEAFSLEYDQDHP